MNKEVFHYHLLILFTASYPLIGTDRKVAAYTIDKIPSKILP